jgi:hypothetical protein
MFISDFKLCVLLYSCGMLSFLTFVIVTQGGCGTSTAIEMAASHFFSSVPMGRGAIGAQQLAVPIQS